MNQTVGMRMAKASEKDLRAALDLSGVLDDIDKGYYPRNPAAKEEEEESGEHEPLHFDEEDHEHLRALFQRLKYCLDASPGGVFRAVFGMATLLDPRNEIVDPALDYLELHPRIHAALQAAEKDKEQS
jgi:hypothetical protein